MENVEHLKTLKCAARGWTDERQRYFSGCQPPSAASHLRTQCSRRRTVARWWLTMWLQADGKCGGRSGLTDSPTQRHASSSLGLPTSESRRSSVAGPACKMICGYGVVLRPCARQQQGRVAMSSVRTTIPSWSIHLTKASRSQRCGSDTWSSPDFRSTGNQTGRIVERLAQS